MDNSVSDIVERIKSKAKSAQDVEAYEAEEKEKAKRDRWEYLRAVGVPLRLRSGLVGLRRTPIVERVDNWLAAPEEAWCLVLSSRAGAGKSTAAAAALWRHSKGRKASGKPIRNWWTGDRLARVDVYKGQLETIAGASFLVLDDLGTEYLDTKGNLHGRLDFVINERYENFRRTIITTNLSGEDFAARYGERIASRCLRSPQNDGGGFWAFGELPDLRGAA